MSKTFLGEPLGGNPFRCVLDFELGLPDDLLGDVRQALELLTGQTGASLTYGPEGNHRPGRNTQSLLKA